MFLFTTKPKLQSIEPSFACPECGQRLSNLGSEYECSSCKHNYTHYELMNEYRTLACANHERKVRKRDEIDLVSEYRDKLEAERAKVYKLEAELAKVQQEYNKRQMQEAHSDPTIIHLRINAIESRLGRLEAFNRNYIAAYDPA